VSQVVEPDEVEETDFREKGLEGAKKEFMAVYVGTHP